MCSHVELNHVDCQLNPVLNIHRTPTTVSYIAELFVIKCHYVCSHVFFSLFAGPKLPPIEATCWRKVLGPNKTRADGWFIIQIFLQAKLFRVLRWMCRQAGFDWSLDRDDFSEPILFHSRFYAYTIRFLFA